MPISSIKYVEKIIPDAYHGTTLERSKDIVKDGKFVCSHHDKLYLGDGVYFFESSEWHAKDWAVGKAKDGKICVFRATVNLGRCLDLNNYKHRTLIANTADQLRTRLPYNKITDAAVINFIGKVFSLLVDTVRATYMPQGKEKTKIFPNSRFSEYVHIMICVRNVENILNFSVTYRGDASGYLV